jgi:atypical dual specificity phosphatase
VLDSETGNAETAMDTWWTDKPRLVGSRNPSDSDLERLRRDGFGVLVSLVCEKERAPRYDIARATALGYVRYNIPVRDFSPPTLDQLEQFAKLVDESPAGTKMIVHCEGGTGRTGTFAAAYWVTKGMTAADAILHVRKARWRAVETPEQEAVLAEFANRIRLRS